MPPVIHGNRKLERKRLQQFKRTARRSSYKSGSIKPKKEFQRKNENYDLIVQDFVLDYNFPNPKSIQKRRLSTDDYDWDWAPAKTHRPDVSLNEYFSYKFDASQIVSDWVDTEPENSLLSSEGDINDSLNAKVTDFHIVTIDEVIEFDSMKSTSEHDPFQSPLCFDINNLCEIVGSEEGKKDALSNEKQKNALDVLLTFTNNRLVVYEDHEKVLKDVKQFEPYGSLFERNDSCEDEANQDQWYNDCQNAQLNFGRCFKCRQKVGRV